MEVDYSSRGLLGLEGLDNHLMEEHSQVEQKEAFDMEVDMLEVVEDMEEGNLVEVVDKVEDIQVEVVHMVGVVEGIPVEVDHMVGVVGDILVVVVEDILVVVVHMVEELEDIQVVVVHMVEGVLHMVVGVH